MSDLRILLKVKITLENSLLSFKENVKHSARIFMSRDKRVKFQTITTRNGFVPSRCNRVFKFPHIITPHSTGCPRKIDTERKLSVRATCGNKAKEI